MREFLKVRVWKEEDQNKKKMKKVKRLVQGVDPHLPDLHPNERLW